MMRNIGILGAMAQEIDEVKALLTEKTIVNIANREFVVGKINNVRCVVAFSKWGKVAATITATLLIQEFGVTDLFFIGTAGALADGLKVGDVVISKRLVQHDLDARPMISRFELPLLNRIYVNSDPELTELAGKAVSNLLDKGVANMVGEEAVKDFNFPKGLIIALLAGFMSGCFNVGLEFGKGLNFGELTDPMFRTLPATLLVTLGGFVTNAIYCFSQNQKNHTWSDYKMGDVWGNNLLFCILAGALWYSQFFGLSLGRSFFEAGGTMDTLSFCILMALNVTFSNVWGIILKEWKGTSKKAIAVLIIGLIVLIISCFLPQLLG